MPKPLQVVAAEMKVKDLVSKSTKKIDKEIKKTTGTLSKSEKQTKKNQKELDKLGKSFDKAGRKAAKASKSFGAAGGGGGGRGGGFRRAGRAGKKGVAAAGGFAGGLTGIPIIGGAIAAILGSFSDAANQFTSGAEVQKRIALVRTNFNIAFQKEGKKAVSEVGGFFNTGDIKKGFSALADFGVDPKLITKNAKALGAFAKAQGFTSLEQGVSALKGGQIKSGRGLDTAQIKQIQALAPLLNDVATSSVAFKQIAQILDNNSKAIDKTAKTSQRSLKFAQSNANLIKREQEKTALEGVKGTQSTFKASQQALRIRNKTTRAIAQSSSKGIKSTLQFTEKFVKDPGSTVKNLLNPFKDNDVDIPGQTVKKRQLGGSLKKGQTALVGERGPETFTPSVSGTVNSNQSSRGGGSVNVNVALSLNGAEELAPALANIVREQLNQLGRTDFRFDTGLGFRG